MSLSGECVHRSHLNAGDRCVSIVDSEPAQYLVILIWRRFRQVSIIVIGHRCDDLVNSPQWQVTPSVNQLAPGKYGASWYPVLPAKLLPFLDSASKNPKVAHKIIKCEKSDFIRAGVYRPRWPTVENPVEDAGEFSCRVLYNENHVLRVTFPVTWQNWAWLWTATPTSWTHFHIQWLAWHIVICHRALNKNH